ncbi:unnamed protein product, partial [Vitis vinifera]|uniref:Uncharacterized protein n=1 Tax=Vitis vinifera TaxID=29760 RepID=D7SQ64_VITVI
MGLHVNNTTGPNSPAKLSVGSIGGSKDVGDYESEFLGQSLGRIRPTVSALRNYSSVEKQVDLWKDETAFEEVFKKDQP